jgi:hypothetical protein
VNRFKLICGLYIKPKFYDLKSLSGDLRFLCVANELFGYGVHSEFYLLCNLCVTTAIVVGIDVIAHNIKMG